MRFGSRILLFFLRPVYRAFFRRPLRKLRAFFLADITGRIDKIERTSDRLSEQLCGAEANLAAQLHTLRAELIPYLQRAEINLNGLEPQLAAQFRGVEANNAAQWDGLEQLLLALFRLPESRISASDTRIDPLDESSYPELADLNQQHAAGTLR